MSNPDTENYMIPSVKHLAARVCIILTSVLSHTVLGGVLYVSEYLGTNAAIIDTDADEILSTFNTTSHTQTAFSILETVRIAASFQQAGSEYDLNGNVLNEGIYPSQYKRLYDGTTDGIFNYSIEHSGNADVTNQVIRFDLDWGNPEILFDTVNRSSGITFDALTNTLWTTESSTFSSPDGFVRQYTMDGTLVSEFDKGSFKAYSIAWDRTDDTLWMSELNTNYLHQFEKDGTFIKSTNFGGELWQNPFGMEFQYYVASVSEPSLLILIVLGIVGLRVSNNWDRQMWFRWSTIETTQQSKKRGLFAA